MKKLELGLNMFASMLYFFGAFVSFITGAHFIIYSHGDDLVATIGFLLLFIAGTAIFIAMNLVIKITMVVQND